ncbi:MAG TPA: YciI family protein [Bryobacteraceae bacterium]|nr:YciI family protein [Bryobacteraceae bacterium]
MQFLLLIYDREARWTEMDEAQQNAETQEFGAFGQEFAGSIRGGNALLPTSTAKTVRVRGGSMQVTDGPFAETKEQLGGYYLVEAKDIDEAASIAAKIPWSRSGSIEVRPIMIFS